MAARRLLIVMLVLLGDLDALAAALVPPPEANTSDPEATTTGGEPARRGEPEDGAAPQRQPAGGQLVRVAGPELEPTAADDRRCDPATSCS